MSFPIINTNRLLILFFAYFILLPHPSIAQNNCGPNQCINPEGFCLNERQVALMEGGNAYGNDGWNTAIGSGLFIPKTLAYLKQLEIDFSFSPYLPKIVLIDDGINDQHEALTVSAKIDVPLNNNPTTTNNPPTICCKHGSACAGIIAANPENDYCVRGVAYGRCEVIDLPLFQGVSNFTTYYNSSYSIYAEYCTSLANAIMEAVNQGADIILLPYAFEPCDEIVAAIEYANQNGREGKGTIIVLPAGNYGDDSIKGIDAALRNSLVVGWTNPYNERKQENGCDAIDGVGTVLRCPESTKGQYVDVMAPGSDILTTGHKHAAHYNPHFHGSSAAASYVAGIAALILNIYPEASSQEVEDILKMTSDKIGNDPYNYDENNNITTDFDPKHYYKSEEMAYGKVNAYNAVVSAAVEADIDNITPSIHNIFTKVGQEDNVIEKLDGEVVVDPIDIDLAYHNKIVRHINFRFPNVALPPNAIIQKAIMYFTAATDNAHDSPFDLYFYIESESALPYSKYDLPSNRTYEAEKIVWEINDPWQKRSLYRSPDLSTIIQNVIDNGNWEYNGHLGFKIENHSNMDSGCSIITFDELACLATQLEIVYTLPEGGNNKKASSDFNPSSEEADALIAEVYPSPFDHQLQINLTIDNTVNTNAESLKLNVYNAYGQLIDQSDHIIQRKRQLTLNTQNWAKGVYFIAIQIGNHTQYKEVVKY